MLASENQRNAGSGASVAAGGAVALCWVLAYPTFNFWPLAIIIPLSLSWLAVCAKRTSVVLLVAWIAATAAWLWVHRWIVDVTVVGYPALCIYLSVFTVAYVWVLRRCAHHPLIGRSPMTLLVPLVWVGVEFFRGSVLFHGYPWYLLGHPFIELPALVQSADLFGAYFISLLAAVPAGVVLDLRRTEWSSTKRTTTVVCASVLLAANAGYGYWRFSTAPTESAALHVLLIQTNLPQDNKNGWTSQQQYEDVPHFFQLTTDSLAQARDQGIEPDLIAWPETMLPGLGFEDDAIDLVKNRFPATFAHMYLWHEMMRQAVQEWDVPVLVGSSATVGAKVVPLESGGGRLGWDHRFNSAYLLTPDGTEQRYDKHFLTPFGETMPYISAWPWLEKQMLAFGAGGMTFDLDSSDELTRLTLPAGGLTLSTPICFEDTIARVCRRMVWQDGRKQSQMLINLSNDGWFAANNGGRAHHVQIARFRAIENRVPILRSVNTGYSVSIDSSGCFSGAIGDGRYGESLREGSLLTAVTLDDRRTVYSGIGELLPWLMLALTAVLVLATFILGRDHSEMADPKPG